MDSIFNKLLYEKFGFHPDQVQLERQLELELGMDSREMFELLDQLEETFNIIVDFDEIDNLLKTSHLLYIRKKQFAQ